MLSMCPFTTTLEPSHDYQHFYFCSFDAIALVRVPLSELMDTLMQRIGFLPPIVSIRGAIDPKEKTIHFEYIVASFVSSEVICE